MAPFLFCKTRILVFSSFSSVSSVPFPFHRFSQQYLNYCYGLTCISPISPPNSYVEVLYPVSQNMILFGDCGCNYTEVGWVPNPIRLMALKKGNLETGTHTHRANATSRWNCSDAAEAKEGQWLPANHPKLGERHGRDSPSQSSGGTSLPGTLILDL